MKKILSLLLALTLVFALVACSNEKETTSDPDTSTTQTETESTDINDKDENSRVEGVFVRIRKQTNATITNTLTLSKNTITHDMCLHNLVTDEYTEGDTSIGSYLFDGNMVYVTWEDGERDRYIFNDVEDSLTHSVEDWVFYKE